MSSVRSVLVIIGAYTISSEIDETRNYVAIVWFCNCSIVLMNQRTKRESQQCLIFLQSIQYLYSEYHLLCFYCLSLLSKVSITKTFLLFWRKTCLCLSDIAIYTCEKKYQKFSCGKFLNSLLKISES